MTVERFTTEEEAIRLGNDTTYGLSGAVWTADPARAAARRRAAPPRDGLDQRLQHLLAGGRVGRLQAVGDRARAWPDRPRRVPRDQAHLGRTRSRPRPAGSRAEEPVDSRACRTARRWCTVAVTRCRHRAGSHAVTVAAEPPVTSPADAAAGAKPTIAVRNLWKVFGPAENKIVGTPLAELSERRAASKHGTDGRRPRRLVRRPARRDLRGHGPVGQRQVDARSAA